MKKRVTHLLLTAVLLCLLSVRGYSQGEVSILSAGQFPSTIVDGQSYTLQGYVVNTGLDTLNGNVDVEMSINGSAPIEIVKNLAIGNLLPGDSVMFQKNNHTFTTAMNTSGLNDILVWPESNQIGVTTGDSARQQATFIQGAALKVSNQFVSGLGSFQTDYSFVGPISIDAQNVGSGPNKNAVQFFAQFDIGLPIYLGESRITCAQGESLRFNLKRVSIQEMIESHLPEGQFPKELRLFARETNGIPPVDMAVYGIKNAPASVEPVPATGLILFPNPVGNTLRLEWKQLSQVNAIQVMDLQGRKLVVSSSSLSEIEVGHLPSGKYILRLQMNDGSMVHRSFVK